MSPLSVPNFSPIGARNRVLWRILQSVREEEKKKSQTLVARISEMAGVMFFNLECGLPYLAGTSVATLVQSDKESRSYKDVKIVFTFFLLIYSQCGAPASWATRHTTVCLDIIAVIDCFLEIHVMQN